MKIARGKYEKEEEIIQLESRGKQGEGNLQKHSLEMLEQMSDKLNWKEENLKQEIEAVREEIKQLSKKIKPVKYKLSEEQLRMYNAIREKLGSQ